MLSPHPSLCRLHISSATAPADTSSSPASPKRGREATLYVRGFFSSASAPWAAQETAVWRQSHAQLVKSHGWAPNAFDWDYGGASTGSPAWVPQPIAQGLAYLNLYPLPLASSVVAGRQLSSLLMRSAAAPPVTVPPASYSPAPGGAALSRLLPRPRLLYRAGGGFRAFGVALAADACLNGTRVYLQWRGAAAAARQPRETQRLRAALLALRARYDHVRVVAYSLGCPLVLHALAEPDELLPTQRPDELHMLAAAMTAAEAQPHMQVLSRCTHTYYTTDDTVLRWLFSVAEGAPALGYSGQLAAEQDLTTAIYASECEPHTSTYGHDTSKHFADIDGGVHMKYSLVLRDIIPRDDGGHAH
jgi:hypothetical protein